MKFTIIYLWLLSIMGAIFLGSETAIMKHEMDRENYAMKLNNCNQLIVKQELYGSNK